MTDRSLRYSREKRQREILEDIFADTDLSVFELFRNFPVYTPRFNLARFIAHYELFKMIYNLPGVIIDLGVYRGSSTFTWAKLCEIFCPTDIKKKVYGFDTFEGFPSLSSADGCENIGVGRKEGGYNAGSSTESELLLSQDAMNQDRQISDIDRIQFIKGNVCKTVPEFVKNYGDGLKIAILNLDLDLFEPTLAALDHFAPLMVRGGIIICDEYADDNFGGETRAVDEYFRKHTGALPDVRKFPWHSNPSAYIKADW